jgi:SpoVK/Ycf46/Vps4 family AAA+-type ATPase
MFKKKKSIERIESEILSTDSITVDWSDIAGLDHVRSLIEEVALWPLINPDLFNGIT